MIDLIFDFQRDFWAQGQCIANSFLVAASVILSSWVSLSLLITEMKKFPILLTITRGRMVRTPHLKKCIAFHKHRKIIFIHKPLSFQQSFHCETVADKNNKPYHIFLSWVLFH